jgi:hypothetical protein
VASRATTSTEYEPSASRAAPEKTSAGPVTSSGWMSGKATITTRRGFCEAITWP